MEGRQDKLKRGKKRNKVGEGGYAYLDQAQGRTYGGEVGIMRFDLDLK